MVPLLRTSITADGSVLIATIGGSAETAELDALSAFMNQLRSEADRIGAKRVVVDLRELEFATSSNLKVFAAWLIDVGDRPDRYTVELVSNPAHSWQRRSLRPIAACAPG